MVTKYKGVFIGIGLVTCVIGLALTRTPIATFGAVLVLGGLLFMWSVHAISKGF
jgi:hypothetical protein